jgi:hypothetical protein
MMTYHTIRHTAHEKDTLMSLAPFAKVKGQILANVLQLLCYVYSSNIIKSFQDFTVVYPKTNNYFKMSVYQLFSFLSIAYTNSSVFLWPFTLVRVPHIFECSIFII